MSNRHFIIVLMIWIVGFIVIFATIRDSMVQRFIFTNILCDDKYDYRDITWCWYVNIENASIVYSVGEDVKDLRSLDSSQNMSYAAHGIGNGRTDAEMIDIALKCLETDIVKNILAHHDNAANNSAMCEVTEKVKSYNVTAELLCIGSTWGWNGSIYRALMPSSAQVLNVQGRCIKNGNKYEFIVDSVNTDESQKCAIAAVKFYGWPGRIALVADIKDEYTFDYVADYAIVRTVTAGVR